MKKKIFVLLTTLFLCFTFTLGFAACNPSTDSNANPNGGNTPQEETIERESIVSEGLEYKLLDDGTYQVSKIGACRDIEIVIPSSYNGKAVTSIGDYAFAGNSRLTGVEIPETIKSIGVSAFSASKRLKNIYITSIEAWCNMSFDYNANPLRFAEKLYLNNTLVINLKIPDSVTAIAESAFISYGNLTSVEVGSGVTTIGKSAFADCSGLKSVTLGENVTSIGVEAFSRCNNLTSVTLGESVTSISESAFAACTSLQFKVYGNANYLGSKTNEYFALIQASDKTFNGYRIHNNTKIIADSAFAKCNNVANIIIPDGVAFIGEKAFFDCYNLTGLSIGKGVKSIGNLAFMSCSNLKEVNVKDIKAWCNISFGNDSANSINDVNDAFSSNDMKLYFNGQILKKLIIPDGVTSIGNGLFYNCRELESVEIPGSVTFIGENAFDKCYALTNITVSQDNAAYFSQDGILYNKAKTEMLLVPKNLTGEVTIADGITSIVDGTFSRRANLTSVGIPASVTSISESAFSNCENLKNITVSQDNATYFSQDGILYSKAKTEFVYIPTSITGAVTIPYGITTIPHSAFETRINLTSVAIPDSVTTIESHAFSICRGLTSVTIPDSVTTILHHAFSSCDSLKNVVFGESVTSIGDYAFEYCSSLTSVTVPEGLTSIGSGAFSDSVQFNEYGNGKYLASKTNAYFILVGGINREITSCDIHTDTKMIAPDAFYDYDNLTEIVIPDGVTMMGADVFDGCMTLTVYCEVESRPSAWNDYWNGNDSPVVWDCKNNDVATDGYIYVMSNGLRYQLKDGVATVARQAKNITAANVSKSVIHKGTEYPVTSIDDSAFAYCYNLTSLNIPESIKSIGKKAFESCSSLSFKEYKNGKYLKCGTNDYFALIEIKERYFYHYSIHSDTKIIASEAFQQCNSAEVVVIGDSVISISEKAFFACGELRSIIISDSVTFIGDSAFGDCKSLTSVYYLGTAEDWAKIQIASGNDNLTSATVYYYIEKEENVPKDGGKYWHYDDEDNMVAW